MPLSFGHDEDDAEIKVSEIVEQANAKYLNWGKANSTSYDCFSLLATNPQTEHIVTV
jgi:seryl-tRNA(Sec) selenium transferase